MNPRIRQAALHLQYCRKMLILGEVAKMLENLELLRQAEARFSDSWGALPFGIQAWPDKYLYHPVRRMIERRGLIYYRGRIHL